MKRKTIDIIISIIWIILIVFTLFVCFVDVKHYEITNTSIGLYSLNKLFLFNIKNNNDYYKTIEIVSNCIFLFCLSITILILFIMLFDYFKRRKIKKTHINFVIHFIVMILIWIIFDKILIINYRPILINGNIEGSYPSTHVMVSTFILLLSSYKVKDIFKNTKILYIISSVLIFIQCISRLLLMMHWFTDILGGLLIGILLFITYYRGEYGFSNSI